MRTQDNKSLWETPNFPTDDPGYCKGEEINHEDELFERIAMVILKRHINKMPAEYKEDITK